LIPTPTTTEVAATSTRRRRVPIIGFVAVFVALMLGRADAAQPKLDASVRSSPQPPQAQVDAFASEWVRKLASSNPTERSAARDQLIAEATADVTAQQKPNPGFLDAYARSLNTALLPLAKHAEIPVRLNAAIVAARVAEAGKNRQLVPYVTAALADENPGVVRWALKAARWVMAPSLVDPKLSQAIVDAAKRAPALYEFAYEAFSEIDPKNANQLKPSLTIVHQMLEGRIAQYGQGIPPEPLDDTEGTILLAQTGWWNGQAPEQKTKTLQLFVNLGSVAGQRVQSAGRDDLRQSLNLVVQRTASAGLAVGILKGANPQFQVDLKPVTQITPRTPAAEVAKQAATIYPAMKKEFPELSEPPKLAASNAGAAGDMGSSAAAGPNAGASGR
jgi:hypothetical protein